ncbi:MAG: PAAR domain-containing protein [Sterolibacteriaceae bacterium]|nr:PAAR domain-containing protein [Candidatus Methylophosphatis haderslevensis]
MPEAARIGDEISHTQARLGFIVGSVAAAVFEGVAAYGLGCALAGLACAFPFGTIAAIGIGLAVGVLAIGPIGDFIQSTGEAIGRTFTVVTGNLVAIGSADVFVNTRPAVRASNNTLDFGACSKHSPLPQKYVIEGAETVFINQWNAARKGDHLDCDATISQGSDNVFFGSPPALVGSFSDREISDDMRRYAGYLRMAAGIVGGSLVGATGLRCFLGNVAVGVGVGVGASGVLSNVIPHMEYGANAGNAAGTAIGNWLQGKPVDVASGAKILPDEVDIDLPGAFPLVWSRFYNSRDDRAGIHGRGWSTPQSLELVFREGQLIYLGHQGRENLFPDPAPNESVYNPAEQLKITRSIGGHYFVSYPGDDLIYSFGPRHTQQDGERLRLRRAMDIYDNGIDFHYDAGGLLAEMVSSAGHVLTLHYQRIEGAGMRLAEIRLASHADEAADPAAPPGFAHPGQRATGIPLVRYEYSAQGDLVAVIDRTGQVVRRFAWRQHMMVSQQFASGLQSHYEWDRHDPFGRVVRQHGNDGEDLRFEYFDTPLDLALQRPASAVQLAGMAPDGLAPFTVREVRVTDQLGRLQQFVCNRHFLITCFVDPLGATVRDEWDANRRLVRHTDALGNITEFEYDGRAQLAGVRNALGQTAQIKWHEQFARIRAVKHYDGTEWRYDYDALGTLVRIAGPQGYSESVQVDEHGLPVRRTDARGGQVRLRYNEQAQLVEYTDCSNRTTRYDYDREGRLRSVVDALGQQSDYARDELGRLTALKLPDGATHRYEYDPSGQPVAYIDPLGRPTRYHYNLRGELIEREDAAGGTLELGYDAAFRRTVLINENLRSYRFAYDDADRLVEEQRLDGTRIRIDYDAANRPIAVTHYPSAQRRPLRPHRTRRRSAQAGQRRRTRLRPRCHRAGTRHLRAHPHRTPPRRPRAPGGKAHPRPPHPLPLRRRRAAHRSAQTCRHTI